MSGGLHPTRDKQVIAEALAELKRAGFTVSDRMQLRFHLEAPSLRAAVALAEKLRSGRDTCVQIRPVPRHLLTARRWRLIVTTPPAPLMSAVVQLWGEQLDDVTDQEGCSVVGWRPLLTRGG